jgi:hypothetical protein
VFRARFAAAGYSPVGCAFDRPSHSASELCDWIDRAGRDVLPAASGIVC